jgi:prepilin-type N-terminal cleavage/methylation domain-containing protein
MLRSTKQIRYINNDGRNRRSGGFSLLELIVVMAISGTILLFAYPTLQKWNRNQSLEDNVKEFYRSLTDARFTALSRGTTVRVNIAKTGDVHTITRYYLTDAKTSCDSSEPWVNLDSKEVILNSNFASSGTAIDNNICFYRDGSSSGANLSFSQKDGGEDLGQASMEVIMATGFVDLIESY